MNGIQELPDFSLEIKDIFSDSKVVLSSENSVVKGEPLSGRAIQKPEKKLELFAITETNSRK